MSGNIPIPSDVRLTRNGVDNWILRLGTAAIYVLRCDSSGAPQETVLTLDWSSGTLTLADVGAISSTGLLTVGDGTASPEVRLSKTDTGTATINLYSGGEARGRIQLDANEN